MIKIATVILTATFAATAANAFPSVSGVPSTQEPHSDAEAATIITSYLGLYHGFQVYTQEPCTVAISQPDAAHLVFVNQNGDSLEIDIKESGLLNAVKYEDGTEIYAGNGSVEYYGTHFATVDIDNAKGLGACNRLSKI